MWPLPRTGGLEERGIACVLTRHRWAPPAERRCHRGLPAQRLKRLQHKLHEHRQGHMVAGASCRATLSAARATRRPTHCGGQQHTPSTPGERLQRQPRSVPGQAAAPQRLPGPPARARPCRVGRVGGCGGCGVAACCYGGSKCHAKVAGQLSDATMALRRRVSPLNPGRWWCTVDGWIIMDAYCCPLLSCHAQGSLARAGLLRHCHPLALHACSSSRVYGTPA